MSLSSVFQIAQNSLSAMTRRTAVLSRNINDATNPGLFTSGSSNHNCNKWLANPFGSTAADAAVEKASLAALSKSAGQTLLSGQLETLNSLLAGGMAVFRYRTAWPPCTTGCRR